LDEDRVNSFFPVSQTSKVKMNITLTPPAELCLRLTKKGTSASVIPEAKLIESSPNGEPEGPLWKLSARPGSPKFAVIELCVLALFLLVAFAGIVSCFVELSHLLQSDAVGYVAMKAINGGG
jgi:hypothetical protein